jgi:hypothetical protein
MMWKEIHGNELYVFYNGVLIYKRWLDRDIGKTMYRPYV